MPSAHTGRMRWKSCVFDGSGKVAPVGAAIGRPPVSLAVFCGRAMLAPTAVTLLHRPPHQSACGCQIPLKGKPLNGSIHWYSMKYRLFYKMKNPRTIFVRGFLFGIEINYLISTLAPTASS